MPREQTRGDPHFVFIPSSEIFSDRFWFLDIEKGEAYALIMVAHDLAA